MQLRWIDDDGVSDHDSLSSRPADSRSDGFLWLDIPAWSAEVEALLAKEFGFHPMALAASRDRNHVPRLHVYPDHAVHRDPRAGDRHRRPRALSRARPVHRRSVPGHRARPAEPRRSRWRRRCAKPSPVAERMESGRLRPTSPFGLTYAIVSTIARREAALVADIARQVGLLEQRVMASSDEEPQEFLTQLFTARHELLTIKTMAAQGGEIYRRAIKLITFARPEGNGDDGGSAGPVRAGRLDQPEPAGLPDGRDRVLPGADRHQDDHRRRTAGGDRRDHPAGHRHLLGRGHERDRQRVHPLGAVDHPARA